MVEYIRKYAERTQVRMDCVSNLCSRTPKSVDELSQRVTDVRNEPVNDSEELKTKGQLMKSK